MSGQDLELGELLGTDQPPRPPVVWTKRLVFNLRTVRGRALFESDALCRLNHFYIRTVVPYTPLELRALAHDGLLHFWGHESHAARAWQAESTSVLRDFKVGALAQLACPIPVLSLSPVAIGISWGGLIWGRGVPITVECAGPAEFDVAIISTPLEESKT